MPEQKPNHTLSGDFDGPVAAGGGDAVDMRGSQGPIYKPSGDVKQHFGPALYVPLAGVALLAVGLVIAAMVFNIGPLTALLPTPMPFRPAEEDETLIIVADFDDRSAGTHEGVDPAQYIYERLVAQIRADDLDIRVERLHQRLNDNTVQSTGETFEASLVVWGWYDALTITPHVRWIRTYRSQYESSEEGEHTSLANPTEIELRITADIPNKVTYLVMLMLASDRRSYGHHEQALAYLNIALEAGESSVEGNFYVSEAYFMRGLIYLHEEEYQRALSDYDRVLSAHSDDIAAHQNRGVALLNLGEYKKAIQDFSYTLSQAPDLARAYFTRGQAYKALGEVDKAIADFETFLELSSEEYDWLMRGQAEQYLRELEGDQP